MKNTAPELLRESSDVVSDYKKVINNMAKMGFISQNANMRLLEERFTNICDKATSILKPPDQYDMESKEEASKVIDKLESINLEVQDIGKEINQRVQAFLSSLSYNQKLFDEEVNEITNNYNNNIQAIKDKHSTRMREMKKEIDHLNSSFDNRLAKEINSVIEQKEEITKNLSRLNNEFVSMKLTYEQQLKITDSKVDALNNELQIMERTNIDSISRIEEKYQKQIEEKKSAYISKVTVLQSKIQEIRESMTKQENEFNIQSGLLNQKIAEMNRAHSAFIKEQHEQKEAEFKIFYESKVKEYKEIEESTAKKREQKHNEYLGEKRILVMERDSLEKEVSSMSSIMSEKLKAAKKEAELAILNKEADLKHQNAENKKAIEQTKLRYSKDINEHKKKLAQSITILEQKLIQTVNQIDAQQKQLEAEVASLIREKTRMEKEYKKIAPSRAPGRDSRKYNIEHINGVTIKPDIASSVVITPYSISYLFENSDAQANQKLVQHREFSQKIETEIRLIRNEHKKRIEQHNRKRAELQDEIRFLKSKLEATENRYHAAENSDQINQRMAESALQNKLNMQKDAIRQLKEEILRAQAAESIIPQLEKLIIEHKRELTKIDEALMKLPSQNAKDLSLLAKVMESEANTDKKKSIEMIQKSQIRLEDSMQELLSAKERLEDEYIKENTKWMELRNEIVETSLRVLNASSPRVKVAPSKPVPLPLLKK